MARLEAVSNIMIKGIGYVTRGDVFDIDDRLIDARIQRCCVNANGSPITIEVRTLEDLTLAELKVKAQAAHVSYGEKTTKKQLIERLLEVEETPKRVQ